MKKFIWISGPINSGKTTVAGILTEKISNAIHIELDVLSHLDNKLLLEEKLNFTIEDAMDLAKNWSDRNFLPILSWPLNGAEAEFMLKCAEGHNLEPVIINLVPGIETVKQNRGSRELTDWELDRIDFMYHVYRINEPLYGARIDNTHLTPEETVNKILSLLREEYFMDI